MIELELKSVVDDLDACRARVEASGGRLTFQGQLEDRRYDTTERALGRRDHVLRTRSYRDGDSARAEINWKGPTAYVNGYKQREEIGCGIHEADAMVEILERLGFTVSMAIDREVWQYELSGASVRFERYPRMDDLVEVEGPPDAIERAIKTMAIPRANFSTDRLAAFVRRYESRTGGRAMISRGALSGVYDFDPNDA